MYLAIIYNMYSGAFKRMAQIKEHDSKVEKAQKQVEKTQQK